MAAEPLVLYLEALIALVAAPSSSHLSCVPHVPRAQGFSQAFMAGRSQPGECAGGQ
jgi:hypothetical protein